MHAIDCVSWMVRLCWCHNIRAKHRIMIGSIFKNALHSAMFWGSGLVVVFDVKVSSVGRSVGRSSEYLMLMPFFRF